MSKEKKVTSGRPKKGKVVIIVLVILFVIGAAIGSQGDKSDKKTETSSTKETKGAEVPEERQDDDKIEVTDFLTCPTFAAEKNSNAMVDQIAATAKENATNLTDEQAAEIISAISAADHKFYNGPEEMEKYMWYGYLLDYKYDDSDPRSSLGTDLCQAIKYVYRKAETVLDDSTHENLLQIDKDLEAIQ